MWFLAFLGEKLILDFVVNTELSNFACLFFFRKIYILAQKQICSQERD